MLAPMATTALCDAASVRASSGGSVRGSASRWFVGRIRSRFWMFSGALMIAASVRWPSVVRPRSTSSTRSDAAATCSK